MTLALVELVANVAEGRDAALVADLVDCAASASAHCLDVHSDPDHNRSVLTFAGTPSEVANAACRLETACLDALDISTHEGVHPRLGTLDVCPFVQLEPPARHDAALTAARQAVAGIVEQGVPVLYYDLLSSVGRTLPVLRKGAFRQFGPDAGPQVPHPRAGAVAVGVRPVLVAFNVDIGTRSLDVARRIATEVRETSGGVPGLRAFAFWLPAQQRMQISMNLTQPGKAGIGTAWLAVQSQAAKRGVQIVAGELVGLAPLAALSDADDKILEAVGIGPARTIEGALSDAGLRPVCAGPLVLPAV